jgi:hypothetical protein
MRRLGFLGLLLLCSLLFAADAPDPDGQTTAPSGACYTETMYVVTTGSDAGEHWCCISDVWTQCDENTDNLIIDPVDPAYPQIEWVKPFAGGSETLSLNAANQLVWTSSVEIDGNEFNLGSGGASDHTLNLTSASHGGAVILNDTSGDFYMTSDGAQLG